ncbi:serine/threonine-protein kinase [Sphaerisporangium corydalis]|uniref:Serine/threonine-protein kinase n=1 Tax=Sphaerisporangium corydalis TaxID=1441875 RepID=A0ABV9ERT3_9ACTN|nr:serine/threonine-protein kinase [Sphaerisporangium corydalis]
MKESTIDGQSIASPLKDGDPTEIGPYTLVGRLGEGGMGTVYLGTSSTGLQVAVKVVKRQFTEDKGFAARFRSEVASARRVASFCTARVLDDGIAEDGRPYMATAFISGTPLSAQIAEYGPLEESPLVGVAFGVCAALAAIHAAGLVHRDLKPGNVILSTTGPRVIDFGIARVLDGLTGPTLTGEVVGTPGWWAPEQIDGRPVTPATDVYAWGCLVAHAGSGRHPFGTGDPMTVAYRTMHEEPDVRGLPEQLDRLVRRALDRDPAARPTAQELLLALIGGDSASDGPATHVLEEMWEPPENLRAAGTPPAPAARGRRRGSRWAAATVALGAALALVAAVLWVRGHPLDGEAAGPLRADDVGRRVLVGDQGLQIVLHDPPGCGGPAYEDGHLAAGMQTCHAEWFVLNLGGSTIRLAGPLDLVDDRAGRHKVSRVVRAGDPLPGAGGAVPAGGVADVRPGQTLVFGGEYVIAAGLRAVALAGPVVSGGETIEVRV